MIRTGHILVFTFKCRNDFNSRIIKISFLFFYFALLLFFNTSFVDELTLHNIFVTGGKLSILFSIKDSIYITLFISVAKNILMWLIFTDNDVLSIKTGDFSQKASITKHVLNTLILRSYLFFIFSLLILSFIWFYISCFFTVFKNTQIFVIKNTSITLVISIVFPFVYYLIPSAMRIIALESRESKNRLCLYVLSKILQVIF